MKILPIFALTALSMVSLAAENEPPKLAPLPKFAAPPVVQKTEVTKEQAEIEKMNADYIAAFNRGDFKAAADFYAEDAEQSDGEGGVLVSGREAIAKDLKAYFDANKGAQLALRVESVRPIAPDVLIEKGDATVAQPDGKTETSGYLAVHVKRGGRWVVAQLEQSAPKAESAPYSHLRELEWMIGSWRDNSPDVEVRTTCQWAANRTFMTRSFSAKSKDRGEVEGTEVLGWDPIKGHIRAWIFDSEGGYSEAIWTRDGNRWLVQSLTTLPDGRKASAHHTITHVNDDKYTWESTNRVVDGELRPNIERIEIERVKSDN